jgi:hypothetical protein
MREIRQSGSEGGARFNPSFLPLFFMASLRDFGTWLARRSRPTSNLLFVLASQARHDLVALSV